MSISFIRDRNLNDKIKTQGKYQLLESFEKVMTQNSLKFLKMVNDLSLCRDESKLVPVIQYFW